MDAQNNTLPTDVDGDARAKWALAALAFYVALLAFATADELFGWGVLAPYF
ncbi:hypothetical protein KDL45_02520 [bacterium]|nr:hypothetical protein [bacterium]MCB9480013.1 hypothetical protein [Deltaproteobacteria bacterium]